MASHTIGPFQVNNRPLTTAELSTLDARPTWNRSTLSGNRFAVLLILKKIRRR